MSNEHKRAFFEKLVSSTKAYSKQDAQNMGDYELSIVAGIVGSVREQERKTNKIRFFVLHVSMVLIVAVLVIVRISLI